MEKKIEFNINDERAGKIAEVIANKTCKKILALIAENDKELSVGDISNRLGIPINTADYNVRKLMGAGLIEKTSSFFWSVKGKRIPTYKIANKKIIISPKTSFKGMIASIIAGGVIFGGLKYATNSLNKPSVQVMLSKDAVGLTSPSEAAANLTRAYSLFNNVLLWVLIGVIVGLLLFLTLKKLKGGKK